MNNSKNLRELCDMLDVSRRTVQGYENAGLVSATEKNKYGHLLYDENAQKRIANIRIYQQLGFKIKEIKEIIDVPDLVIKKDVIERQIARLKEKQTQTENLIEKAYELIEGL